MKWSDEWIAKGEARGEAKGQRTILVRMAQARFGTDAATEFADHLDGVDSTESLFTIGDWLITCSSSEALLNKIRES